MKLHQKLSTQSNVFTFASQHFSDTLNQIQISLPPPVPPALKLTQQFSFNQNFGSSASFGANANPGFANTFGVAANNDSNSGSSISTPRLMRY